MLNDLKKKLINHFNIRGTAAAFAKPILWKCAAWDSEDSYRPSNNNRKNKELTDRATRKDPPHSSTHIVLALCIPSPGLYTKFKDEQPIYHIW